MTLRELLKALNAVDEKVLDLEVMVSPHTGGYDSISHVSVLDAGHPVLHEADNDLLRSCGDCGFGLLIQRGRK